MLQHDLHSLYMQASLAFRHLLCLKISFLYVYHHVRIVEIYSTFTIIYFSIASDIVDSLFQAQAMTGDTAFECIERKCSFFPDRAEAEQNS